jgi:hypothetical protein
VPCYTKDQKPFDCGTYLVQALEDLIHSLIECASIPYTCAVIKDALSEHVLQHHLTWCSALVLLRARSTAEGMQALSTAVTLTSSAIVHTIVCIPAVVLVCHVHEL